MRNTAWVTLVFMLLCVIGILGWFLLERSVADVAHPSGQPTNISKAISTKAPGHANAQLAPRAPLSERVAVLVPTHNQTVSQTFTVSGKAPGAWYFEASFPIQVRDQNERVIGRAHGNAQGDWMTTDLVSFSATVNIEGNYQGLATLILLRDNPSGLPENDDSVSIPIRIQ